MASPPMPLPETPTVPPDTSPRVPDFPSPPSSSSSSSSPPPPTVPALVPVGNTGSTQPISTSEGGPSIPFIIGISVGGTVVFLVLVLLFTCWKWNNKKRGNMKYNGGSSSLPPLVKEDNQYGGQPQNWQYNVTPPTDHSLTIPSSLPRPPAYATSPPFPPGTTTSSAAVTESGSSAYSFPFGRPVLLPPPSPSLSLGFSRNTFSYDDLSMATDGFSDANFLGQGGFGYVHKGVLPNGNEVAVKQLKAGSCQGEREFQAEIDTISRVHHKHLVSLIGHCLTDDKMLLVYEFVPNKTMEFHLHGNGRTVMDWPTRLKIALGSAKGIAYLHEDCHPKIIHRDIKAANILLDFKFEAKVADFGLAKFSPDENTHISTRVMGTFGYLAPEYASSGKLTDKSDVFSFGVMLLELISGKRPVDMSNAFMDDSLVDWARPLLSRAIDDDNFDALADRNLQQNYNRSEMACMISCAASCIRHSARRRPRMSQIVRALEGDISLENLNDVVKPGQRSIFSSYGSSDFDASQCNDDVKNFRKLAPGNQELVTSDNSATPDSCQNPSGTRTECPEYPK